MRVLAYLKKHQKLDNAGALGAFVNAVCGNVLMERVRHDSRARAVQDTFEEYADLSPLPEAAMVTAERRRAVTLLIQTLSASDQAVLRAVFLDEEDRDQVCERMGISRDYLRVLIFRARNRFRAELRGGSFQAAGIFLLIMIRIQW